jgi:hypothetical protein
VEIYPTQQDDCIWKRETTRKKEKAAHAKDTGILTPLLHVNSGRRDFFALTRSFQCCIAALIQLEDVAHSVLIQGFPPQKVPSPSNQIIEMGRTRRASFRGAHLKSKSNNRPAGGMEETFPLGLLNGRFIWNR